MPRPSKCFPFLDLPPEIRDKIYTYVCASPHKSIPLDHADAHSTFPLNLLLTNQQIYQEARPIYFTSNSFSLVIRRNNHWDYILEPKWQDNLRQIRKIKITALRWGTKDFFCNSVAPALEDCILNGHLRSLDVVIKKSYLKIFRTLGGGMGGYQPWRALKKLCEDPYLEHVGLRAVDDEILTDNDDNELRQVDETLFKDISYLLGGYDKDQRVKRGWIRSPVSHLRAERAATLEADKQ